MVLLLFLYYLRIYIVYMIRLRNSFLFFIGNIGNFVKKECLCLEKSLFVCSQPQ